MKKNKKTVYLDYAATTPVDPKVLSAMLPFFSEKFGNPASLYQVGREANMALDSARNTIAGLLKINSGKIVFTGSATESNNLALKGVALANKEKGNHLIVSAIEHDCVLSSAAWLEQQGFKVTYLPVDKFGLVNSEDLVKALTKETILVSIMHANNEIGTIEPIKEIGALCRRRGVFFHTDAAQTFGKIPIDIAGMNIDMLTASSHKIYGPKGAALLYLSDSVKIEPIIHGGGQEFGLRSSTVNVPAIVGFAKAAEISFQKMVNEGKRLTLLRNKLINGVLNRIPGSYLNGHPKKRLPNNVNFRFDFVEGESIVLRLDALGVAASTGSACSSPKLTPSHVLVALGLNHGQAHGSLRLTLGRWSTKEKVDYLLKVLPGVIEDLREISPFKS
ncbi:MAG: cysteine desulfurase family protein [Patescibacteria group bacterium]